MRPIRSRGQLEDFGRVRLSPNFFMRDFLFSEVAAAEGLLNAPDDPELATAAGMALCQTLLEPLSVAFGRVTVRSAYRSCEVNARCNALKAGCANNEANYAAHIWDRRDSAGRMGATACIVLPGALDLLEDPTNWQALAWWIHDRLPYSTLEFFPRLLAFNIQWREDPERSIYSRVPPQTGYLTRAGMNNQAGDHSALYRGLPQ